VCGIAGVWNFATPEMGEAAFRAFLDTLRSRGPDGVAVERFAGDRLHLGHRRLSILDLSERGRQPMAFAAGRWWITYNGEVFNFVELRAELEGLGYHFVSESDTEVVVAAYAAWGADCLLKFNGMWALAIWDDRNKTLFLARDRFGIKPLHYLCGGGLFAFASELKAFTALDGYETAIDPVEFAAHYVNNSLHEATDGTFLRGVRKLPAGHCMTVFADGRTVIRKWWDLLAHLREVPHDFRNQTEEMKALFYDACRLRLRSDVPVATALSGGLDSSSVACVVNEIGRTARGAHAPPEWQKAFVACFKGTPLNERRYAERVVAHTGMTPVYIERGLSEGLAQIEGIIWANEAIMSAPHVGPWAIYGAMREQGIVVSMDGHGADEAFAGYHFFPQEAIVHALQTFDFPRWWDMRRTLTGFVGGSVTAIDLSVRRDAMVLAKAIWQHLAGRPAESAVDPRVARQTPLFQLLYHTFHRTVLPTILRNFDRGSMARSIEIRMPFLDWRIVTLAFSLPDQAKLGHGYAKRIIREAMKGVLPEDIRTRTNKIGLTSPTDTYLRGPLREFALDTVANRAFAESPYWDGAAVREQLESGLAGRTSVEAAWQPINAFHLLRQFGPSRVPAELRVQA
jgi:asparagine synthase (glutamine-hydrolysing)